MVPASRASILPAASTIVVRQRRLAWEVMVVARAASLRFFGGFHAFPGGKIGAPDVPPGSSMETTEAQWAAARELFEETGILVARDLAGRLAHLREQDRDRWRRQLIDEKTTFPEFLSAFQLTISPVDFPFVGRLVTPAFSPIRFDTAFFVIRFDSDDGSELQIWPGELEQGEWCQACSLLSRWRAGQCLISPPTLLMLQAVADASWHEIEMRLREHFEGQAATALPAIYFSPGVRYIPLRTRALPPSTHTNAYLIGESRAYLLDPGTTDPKEQEVLFAVIDQYLLSGGRLSGILLSHQHEDHVGAVQSCVRRYRVPVLAHALTARALIDKVPVDATLDDRQRLALGSCPDGSDEWFLEVLHTPGHAAGHLAFYEPRYQLLFAGDMVSTQTSIIVAPPEGHLNTYLESLRRLKSIPARLLLPAHGTPSSRAPALIDEALAHRAKREEMLLAALQEAPRSISQLALELYRGVPDVLLQLAELQVLAGLQKLEHEGRVTSTGDQLWRISGCS
jgi:glyoxylase-like metal-dependent hydrolase (beta-lactamase superfamily II)/8-oxo-dGTP pyrophosphatase MutT (NUDIX family)